MTSPFQAVTSLGAWSELTIRQSKQKMYLEKANLIQFAPLPDKEGMLASVMMEVLLQVLLLDETSSESSKLYALLSWVRQSWQTPRWAYLKFLSTYLHIQGVPLIVDYCVQCQSKVNIVAYSPRLGGFICQSCLPKVEATLLPAKALTLLRTFSSSKLAPNEDIPNLQRLIPLVHQHVAYHLDVNLQGFENVELIVGKIHS